MELLYSITLSFRDLGRWDIKKISLINGLIWLFFWLIIGYASWDFIVAISVKVLNIMPFAFVKISGAFIIYTILWIQAIFVTIGVIFALFNEAIEKNAQKENFHYIGLSFGGIIILFWSILFWEYQSPILAYIEHFLKLLPFQTVEELMSIFLAILFFYLLYSVSISFSFLFFIIPKLTELANEEYENISINEIDYSKLMFIIARDFIGFIFLSLLLYPLMLIPFLNFIIIMFLWAYMIKDSYYHVIQSIFNKELNKKEIWALSLSSTILDFLPIINIFAPALGIMNMYHYVIEKEDNTNEL